jgi:hypothetical protein
MEAQSPIPNPLPNDDEDVSWALSTAGALWGRGERAEALKWLRRAAEQASDVNDDVRALTLFKAAAEVAQTASMTPPPPITSTPPPASQAAPQAAPQPSFPPPGTPAPPPPPRKAPPSLPPRTAPPPVPSSRAAPPARTTPPPAPVRQVPSSAAPSPVTKQSRSPAPAPQISPAAQSMPSSALAAAGAPVRRAAPAPAAVPRAVAPARSAAPGATVPTRPVASRPGATTSTPPPAAATERPPAPPPSRGGRAFEEVLALQHPRGGLGFDDLDENTQVLQAVRTPRSVRQPDLPAPIEESFHGVLSDVHDPPEIADELTDPGLRGRPMDDLPPDDQTGPISAPERTAVTKWTDAERAALMAAPDTQAPETTSRRFAPLLAHRVAVVASNRAGEIRLVPLDASGAPPIGAAIALLVPLSAADGDLVAQLFGSLE